MESSPLMPSVMRSGCTFSSTHDTREHSFALMLSRIVSRSLIHHLSNGVRQFLLENAQCSSTLTDEVIHLM